MSCFRFDSECDYQEFRKTICHHADNIEVPSKLSSDEHFSVCQKVYSYAENELKEGMFDIAYYHYLRCITILEKTNLRKRIGSDAKKLLSRCLDAVEELEKRQLPQLHSRYLEEVRTREKARKHIVEMQLMPDDDDTESSREKHLKRQQELLANEGVVVNDTQKTLNDLRITPMYPKQGGATVPYGYDPRREGFPNLNNTVVPLQKIPSTSPNAYRTWSFNTVHSSASFPRRGIVNLGNTCYLNSITQIIYATPLGLYFLGDDYTNDITKADQKELKLVNTFCYVLRELSRTELTTPVSSSFFKESIGNLYSSFAGFQQQDANEFLHVLLEGLHNGLNSQKNLKINFSEVDTTRGTDMEMSERAWSQYLKQNSSIIVEQCAFQERSSLQCPLCHQNSRSFTPLMGLEVPIPSNTGQISIEDCLGAYCKEETLDSDSLYTCPSCKKRVNVSKQLLLYSLPKILFLTIKRFRHFGDFSNKVNDPVIFQKKINMSFFICSSETKTIFSLVGIVNHQGNIHGGHYTADCLGSDGVWFSASDERVLEAKEPDYRQAYILCYVRDD